MNCSVSPLRNFSDFTYQVKCVTVENEREVFGNSFITQQTRSLSRREDVDRFVSICNRKRRNLVQQTLEGPDFMEMNRKRATRRSSEAIIGPPRICYRRSKSLECYESAFTHRDDDVSMKRPKIYPAPLLKLSVREEANLTTLVDQLLLDIYGLQAGERGRSESDSTASSLRPRPHHIHLQKARLLLKGLSELQILVITLRDHINHTGGLLVRQLRRKDYLIARRDKQCDIITAHLQAHSAKRIEDTKMRFSLTPQPGESGFTQWLDAMKMVAKLQGGIPPEFRKRLWLTLAERHLDQRGVDWKQAEKLCFNEWSNPDDEELGIQIVKDLHRTGCSLFCGAAGRDNQAVLRRVLLGFARWNKSVGYCQGLNVLAALVLQVMDRAESSAVKVMIYLIEGVLPEGYFADNLRGLSVDMAVFRDLLRSRLPKLSKHLEALQSDAKDKATGSSYEPPLTNVFTMQWFLTLFCHCLPQEAVLRVWDLIFLEGDEVLLRTALAIWEGLSDRIMTVTSADEFYSIMGVLTREMLEFTDTNNLIKNIVSMGPLHGVTSLREKHRYNITPWARKLSDDEDSDTEEDERLAVAAAAMFSMAQRIRKDRLPATMGALQAMAPSSDRERLALDISTLKQQYAKLRERQRQAHIILSAACARQSMVPPPSSQAMNHLLVGKNALVSGKNRTLSLPSATASPKTQSVGLHSPRTQSRKDKQGVTLHWKDTKRQKQKSGHSADSAECVDTSKFTPQETSADLTSPKRGSVDSDSDSTSTELCDEPDRLSDVDSEEPSSISDSYVMATDDEKNPGVVNSPALIGKTMHSGSELKKDKLEEVQEESPKNETIASDELIKKTGDIPDISIAKITDQIRRLSSEDDNNSTDVSVSCISSREEKEKDDDIAEKSYVDSEFKSVLDRNTEENLGSSSKISSNFEYSTFRPEKADVSESSILLTYQKDYLSVSGDDSKINGNTKFMDTKDSAGIDLTREKRLNTFSFYETTTKKTGYDTSVQSLGYDDSFEKTLDFSSKLSKKMDSLDTSSIKSPNSTDMERTVYSKSYVVGHLPISPISMDLKLNKFLNTSCESSTISVVTPENPAVYTNASLTTENSAFNYSQQLDQPRICMDVKKSPKSPESTKSFSSGDTMGPDSKPSSLMSPRSPIKSESQDFVVNKSSCSSVSSDSKTLVHSEESDVAKKSPRLDLKKDPNEKSNPSTPISADSLGIKSDISPKLIVSSSSDSCSPSKVKSSERSFSSDLQSPISANSIKYTSNYNKRGQDNLSESPLDICTNTSPFYPIAHPNQKTPSPYNANRRRRSIDSNETSPDQKSSSSRESSKELGRLVGYQSKLDPSMKIIDAAESDNMTRKDDVYIRPQFMANKDDIGTKMSVTGKHETNLSSYGSTFNDLYVKPGSYVDDAMDDQSEKDTLPQLPQEKLDKHFLSYNYRRKDRSKLLERSSSSLDKKFMDMKSSASTDELSANTVKKRSSDILEDMKHLEAKALSDGTPNSNMMTKKSSDIWEDLKNLEARRQDTFSDSASSFSKRRLNIPDINVTSEGRKSYIVHPKINIDENSDSILNTVARAKESGDSDDGRESKLGVWTKVKPRKKSDNGRRSSDRALKIIQENSAILHKILACQARKRLPDLEEISKEITISPINEEISKIFSPILEQMGLNEHEINEELARINFKDFDSVATSVSEFDAKINDELSKLSLIDDSEQIDNAGEIVSHDYLSTREALLDRKINEELSKLLANYEEEVCSFPNREKVPSTQNVSDVDGLELSSVSTNVFSYKSSSDSIESRSDFGSAQDATVHVDKYPHYTENVLKYTSPQYVQTLSPKSDIDIYRELEKLDKISSAQVFPDTALEAPQKNLSPISYTPNTSPYFERSSVKKYTAKSASYETSPRKTSFDLYKSFDFEPSISPRKQPTDSYSSASYEKPIVSTTYEYMDRKAGISTDSYSPVISKESLEFRVRYDEESPRHVNRDYLSHEKNDREFINLDKSPSYYNSNNTKPITPTKYVTKEEKCLETVTASFLDYSSEDSDSFRHKYDSFSSKNYSDGKRLEYDRHVTILSGMESGSDSKTYISGKTRDYQSLSPSSRYTDQRYPSSMDHYASKLSSSLNDDLKRPVSHPEFPDKTNASMYTESPSRGSSCYKKSSLSLGNIGHTTKNVSEGLDFSPSPKAQFSPFPVRNAPRKPKELGLKLGLYSSKSSDADQTKKS